MILKVGDKITVNGVTITVIGICGPVQRKYPAKVLLKVTVAAVKRKTA